MQEFTPLGAEERELEQALQSLQLKTVPENEIWYLAGLRAGWRRARLWQGMAAVVLVLLMCFVVWKPKPASITVERIVYVPSAPRTVQVASSEQGKTMPSAAAEYFQLRDAIERRGLDGLPAAGGAGVIDQPVVRAWSPAVSVESVISGKSL